MNRSFSLKTQVSPKIFHAEEEKTDDVFWITGNPAAKEEAKHSEEESKRPLEEDQEELPKKGMDKYD